MRWRSDLIIGLGRRDDSFIIILDIERVFTSDDLANLIPEATAATA